MANRLSSECLNMLGKEERFDTETYLAELLPYGHEFTLISDKNQ